MKTNLRVPCIRGLSEILAALFISITASLSAATLTVTNLNDSGPGSLRNTIAAAASGDTIVIAVVGTIALTGGDLNIDKSLTIEGGAGATFHEIRRTQGPGISPRRIFQFYNSGAVLNVRLSGITFSNGRAANGAGGGGAVSAGANLTVVNCVFQDNQALGDGGGAIRHTGGILDVSGCTFRNNFAALDPGSGGGGAIVSSSSEVDRVISNSVFTGNGADGPGGALWFLHGQGVVTYTVNGCTFESNYATSGGAIEAVAVGSNATLRINDSTFAGNSASVRGGACTVDFLNASADRCTFNANTAPTGGAVFCLENFRPTNCTFAGNSATGSGGGGAIFNQAELRVESCTFSGNSSQQGGGAIHQTATPSPSLVLRNNIFNRTVGSSGANFVVLGGLTLSLGYNLRSDSGAGVSWTSTDQLNTNPQLDPVGLRFNGGPTQTIALLANSPAIDRGNRGGLTTDQRGTPRPWDLAGYPAAPGGDESDCGAFETTDPLQTVPLVVNTLDDHDDGTAGLGDCTLREAINRANALGGSIAIEFAPGLNGVITLNPLFGSLTVASAIQLTGPGARQVAVTVSSSMRVFNVTPATDGATISRLTIRDGTVSGLPTNQTAAGAGILNEGRLTLNDCTLANHRVTGTDGASPGASGGSATGAGIFNPGNLTLNRCTIRDCTATGGRGVSNSGFFSFGGNGGDAVGGAIYGLAGSTLAIFNCTLYNNRATGGDAGDGHFGGNGGNGQGGAIYNEGTMTITSATVTENTGIFGFGGDGNSVANNGANGQASGGLANSGGSSTVRNSIIGNNYSNGNVRTDVFGAFTSGGFNLISAIDGSTGFTQPTDQTGTGAAPIFPNVGALQNNGGDTDTMHPTSACVGLDKGNSFGLATDQRGASRPFDAPNLPNANGGDGSDIGAVEGDVGQAGPQFVVTTLDDHDDAVAGYFDCTLREAINAANYTAGANTIVFRPELFLGTIVLSPGLGRLTINDSVTISGLGARLLAVQGNSAGVFAFMAGTNTLSGITIRGGAITAITGAATGGGIFNQSVLTVLECIVEGNSVTGGEGNLGQRGGDGRGGGAANISGGTLHLVDCTFSGNAVVGGPGGPRNVGTGGRGGDGVGGAVFNDTGCTLSVENCTFAANNATGGWGGASFRGTGGAGGDGLGSAIHNRGSMIVTSATVSENAGTGGMGGGAEAEELVGPPGRGGGALYSQTGSTSTVRNTISAGNTSDAGNPDVEGAFTSNGYNLIGDVGIATGFSATGDQTGTAGLPLLAQLGPLQNNGGPCFTLLPRANSPALDRGFSFGLGSDQRGLLRVVNSPHRPDAPGGDGADIGAVEINPFGSLVDRDGDGMHDEWEIFYGVDDPNADPDNDGLSNRDEFSAGTDPLDNNSFVLRIIAILRNGNDVFIIFNAVAGRTFRLEEKNELSAATWTKVDGTPDLTPGSSGYREFIHHDALSSLSRNFYRVRLLP